MIEILASILTSIILVALAILLVQVLLYIPKLYRFESYKNAERASEKYLESRLLVGIRGKDVSKIASQLDEYLNEVLGVDLNEDELICIVESRLYRTISSSKNIDSITKSVTLIADAIERNANQEEGVKTKNSIKDSQYQDDDIIIKNPKNDEEYISVGYDEIIGGDNNG